MDTAKEIRKGEELDWDKLETYLRKEIPELSGEMSVAQFHGGFANLTYLLKFGETELVLRRPPFGKIAPGAHDMKREYRVLSKLYKHFPRAPRAYHLCEDDSVIGARFVVIERRQGIVIRTEDTNPFPGFENVNERLIRAQVKAHADLHLVDYKAAGLERLGRPEGFLERQVRGWQKRWELVKIGENEVMDEVFKILQSSMPQSPRVSIIHNDMKLDNCQFHPDSPDEVTSIFDWDMCTLGDPLADFGTSLCYYPDESLKEYKHVTTVLKGDWPPKQFFMDVYQEYTGFSLDNISWYHAFAYWKTAVATQQLYKRYHDGATKDKRFANFHLGVKDNGLVALKILTKN